uniref:Uncharacterized protein n=2 Tax=Photinus pyralis TaxID=7054 RepID=A0A1Y1MY12_PHOPY
MELPQVYQELVSDVVVSCFPMFSESGFQPEILMQLEQLWLRKLMKNGNNYVDLDRILLEKAPSTVKKRKRSTLTSTPTVKKKTVIRYSCKPLLKVTNRSMPEIGFHERKSAMFDSRKRSLHTHSTNGVIATGEDLSTTNGVIRHGSHKRQGRSTNLSTGKKRKGKKQHNSPRATLKNRRSVLPDNSENESVPPPAPLGIKPAGEEADVSLTASRSDVPGPEKTESLPEHLRTSNGEEVCVSSVPLRNGVQRKRRIKKATIPTDGIPYNRKLRSGGLCNLDLQWLRTPRRRKNTQHVKPQTPCELNCPSDSCTVSRSKEVIKQSNIHEIDKSVQPDSLVPNFSWTRILNDAQTKTGTETSHEMSVVALLPTQAEKDSQISAENTKENTNQVTKIGSQKRKKRRRLTYGLKELGNDSGQHSGLRLRSGALYKTHTRPQMRRKKLNEQLNIDGQCDISNKLDLNCDIQETDFITTPKELGNTNRDEQCDNLTESRCKEVLASDQTKEQIAVNTHDLGVFLNGTPETTNCCDRYVSSELKRDGNFQLLCRSKSIRVRDYLSEVNRRLENNSFETSDLCQNLPTSVPRQLKVVDEGERSTRTNGNFPRVNRGKLRYNGARFNRKQLTRRRSSGGSCSYLVNAGSNRRAIKLVRNSLGATVRNLALEKKTKHLNESEVQLSTKEEVVLNGNGSLAMANCEEFASILNLGEHTSTQLCRAKPIRLRRDYKLLKNDRIITTNRVNNLITIHVPQVSNSTTTQIDLCGTEQNSVLPTTDLVPEPKDIQEEPDSGTQIIKRNQNGHDIDLPLEVERYSYKYENPYANRTDISKCKRVKIALPPRDGFTKDELTCIIKVPPWALQGSKWTKLLTPIIRRIDSDNLPIVDATSLLQDYINNYEQPVLQVDGVGARFILKSSTKYSSTQPIKTVRYNSDIDSNDDVTDEEDVCSAFQAKNFIWCQFVNIKHHKNVWRLNLKHGAMYLNGKEYFFNSAKGVVTW